MAEYPYRNGRDRTTFDDTVGATGLGLLARLPTPMEGEVEDAPLTTSGGEVVTIDDDGNVFFDPPSPSIRRPKDDAKNFNRNLADELDQSILSSIATEYAQGVEQDIQSRSAFIANYNRGVDLLGLKIEEPSASRGGRGSISKVKHPALMKACIRSQATACAELLPPSGPVRVQTLGNNTEAQNELAERLQEDFNYYMTDVAREYYPDTRRAMFYRAFGGSVYKKVYRCPLRQRPVSESVYLPDLIVGEDALDLSTAQRKTNEIIMPSMQAKRMMLRGGWRDINLPAPQRTSNQARLKELDSQGIAPMWNRADDAPYTIWEGYIYIDPADYGFEESRAPDGMPLPYRIVIDKDSQQVLAFHRNWKQGDEEFREREVFVKYGLIPGLGFLDYGMVHLIGNSTRVLTTLLQIMCDAGMLANFPGGAKIKGVKARTNEINPGLGEFVDLEMPDGVDDIRKALMGMPYRDVSAIFVQLMELIQKDVEQLTGIVEIEVGDQRANMPVGTMMAMLEQRSQTMSAVHQADHQAQKRELTLLRDLFAEHPEDLRWLTRKSGRDWQAEQAFADMDLIPASDPSVPSRAHRLMQAELLKDTAKSAPEWFGPNLGKVIKRVLRSGGIGDGDDYVLSPEEMAQWKAQTEGAQPGAGAGAAAKTQMELPLKAAELQNEKEKLALQTQENQRQAANEAADHAQREREQEADADLATAKLEVEKDKIAHQHTADMASTMADMQPDSLAEANLRKIDAQAFAAMGTGAAGFAKAGETVQAGEQDLANIPASLDRRPKKEKPDAG